MQDVRCSRSFIRLKKFRLKEKAEKLGLSESVRFTGMIPKEEVYRYYQLGDIFVCASTFETQGLTYVEALANALPLVCREDKCLIDIIGQGENGFHQKGKRW